MEKEQKVSLSFIERLKSPDRFAIMDDGWKRDSVTGLDWGPSSEAAMTYKEAEEYCAKVGGRLPEAQELHTLVDFSKEQPAVNKEIFNDTVANWYWSGTKCCWPVRARWCVSFSYGDVNNGSEDSADYVRPCRASQ